MPDTLSLADADIGAYLAGIGLEGIIDIHVHFMPDNVMRKVWRYFDEADPLVGAQWVVKYQLSEAERIALLRDVGVLRYGALSYPHKANMALWLNEWAAAFALANPQSFHCATFYPEVGAHDYVRSAVAAGAQLFKAHVQVGAYDPRDPLLEPVWQVLEDGQVPVIIHCGAGPTPGKFTGIGPISEVLGNFPRLVAVIAHMGNPDYGAFLDLAKVFPNVHLDTTMVFTDFTESKAPFPRQLRGRLVEMAERIVFGSDFPNIPYPFADQIAALANLDLGDEWMRQVLYGNPARLMNI